MPRLLPLLAFALLPAAGAAPVPPTAGRPTFGASGLVTRAELEKVKFQPRLANEKDRLRKIMEEDRKPNRGFERAAVAVHLPWHTFREGEPVPAYFVFKNGGDESVSLDARLDLFGPRPATWNSCSVAVLDRKTDKPGDVIPGAGWRCGGPPLVTVPAGGFYCVGFDLGRTADGKPLPPGEYEVEWRYAWLHSAGVRFTVLKDDGAKPAVAPKRPSVHFYRVVLDRYRHSRPAKAGEPFLWGGCQLDGIGGGVMAAALAVGHAGVYVPNVHVIPVADDSLEAAVEWKPYRDGDRVAVTLSARDPRKPVRLAEVPQLYLQVESAADGLPEKMAEAKELEALVADALVTPLTVEVRLPDDWRATTGATGAARVAVVVTSRAVELPRDRWGVEKIKELRRDFDPTWEGILRTPFVELHFPEAHPFARPRP